MKDLNYIHTYFGEEKIESFIFIFIGVISIVLAFIFLFIIQYSFFKGLAIPLLVIGCIQISVGSIVALRVPKDVSRVEFQMKSDLEKIKTEELPRMEKVRSNFVTYLWIEIILIITGLILLILFYNSSQTFWKGLGLGLLMQAGVMLSLDVIAKKRADKYVISLSISLPKTS